MGISNHNTGVNICRESAAALLQRNCLLDASHVFDREAAPSVGARISGLEIETTVPLVHDRLHMYPICTVVYYPWHRLW